MKSMSRLFIKVNPFAFHHTHQQKSIRLKFLIASDFSLLHCRSSHSGLDCRSYSSVLNSVYRRNPLVSGSFFLNGMLRPRGFKARNLPSIEMIVFLEGKNNNSTSKKSRARLLANFN